MIMCPVCTGDTQVLETRDTASGVRRRRECIVCHDRVTTIEVAIAGERRPTDGMVVVRQRDLDALVALVGQLSNAAEQPL